MTRIGIYPGTFDPITDGHLDVIERALRIVDHLLVAVAGNAGKNPLFSVEERRILAEKVCQESFKGASFAVVSFDKLLVDFARDQGANILIRGLRAVSDFEYEFQMAGMNQHLAPDIETVFLMASDKYQLISSRFVKEIAALGGDVSHFVPDLVQRELEKKLLPPISELRVAQ